MIKLIVSDIDGTLIGSSLALTQRTRDAIRVFEEKRGRFSLCTGRFSGSGLLVAESLGVSAPCVFSDGAMVMRPRTGELLYEQTITTAAMQELAAFCQQHGLVVELYDRTGYFVEHQHELLTMHGRTLQVYPVKRRFEPRFCDFAQLFQLPDLVWIKAVIICDHPNQKKLIEEFASTHERSLRFSSAKGPNKDHHHITFFNITHPSVSKGYAAAMVARDLGISKAQTMAIGDASNDEALFTAADTRVAMGNATAALKRLATHVVPDADHDGAAHAILTIAMKD